MSGEQIKKSPLATGTFNSFSDVFDPLGIGAVQDGHIKSGGDIVDPFKIASPTHSGSTTQELFAQVGKKNDNPATKPPDVANAQQTAFQQVENNLRRRRAFSTLFTGGQGTLDSPSTAPATLIGT